MWMCIQGKNKKRLIRYDKSFEVTFRCVVRSICHHVCNPLTDIVEPIDAYPLYEGYKVHELFSSTVEMENGIICVLFQCTPSCFMYKLWRVEVVSDCAWRLLSSLCVVWTIMACLYSGQAYNIRKRASFGTPVRKLEGGRWAFSNICHHCVYANQSPKQK